MDFYDTLLAKSLAGNGGGSPSSGGAKMIQVDTDYGFIKEWEEEEPTLYTFAEMQQLWEESQGNLIAVFNGNVLSALEYNQYVGFSASAMDIRNYIDTANNRFNIYSYGASLSPDGTFAGEQSSYDISVTSITQV